MPKLTSCDFCGCMFVPETSDQLFCMPAHANATADIVLEQVFSELEIDIKPVKQRRVSRGYHRDQSVKFANKLWRQRAKESEARIVAKYGVKMPHA